MNLFARIAMIATSVYGVVKQIIPFVRAARPMVPVIDQLADRVEDFASGGEEGAARFVQDHANDFANVSRFSHSMAHAWEGLGVMADDLIAHTSSTDETPTRLTMDEAVPILARGREVVDAFRMALGDYDAALAAMEAIAAADAPLAKKE